MEPLPASTLSFERLQRVFLLAALPVGAALGCVVAMSGARATVALLGAGGLLALVIVGLNRLHLTLLPLAVILPLAGYLIILRPEAGFSLVFDILDETVGTGTFGTSNFYHANTFNTIGFVTPP